MRPRVDQATADAFREAARKFAERTAAAVVNYFTTRRPRAMALPANNKFTDMEVTLIGSETCNREYLDEVLAEAVESALPSLKTPPAVIVFHTNRTNRHLVLMQFTWTLECSAIEAEQACHETFRNMLDGESMMGYAFVVTGVRG